MSARRATYLDSSAIVKLVVHEPESAALSRYLRGRRPIVASALARVEVLRVTASFGLPAQDRAHDVLNRLELIRINERIGRPNAFPMANPHQHAHLSLHTATYAPHRRTRTTRPR